MIPKLITTEREKSYDVKIEDIEKILSKNFTEKGSAQRAAEKLKKLLDDLGK